MTDEAYRDPETGRFTERPPWGFDSERGKAAVEKRRNRAGRVEEESKQILEDVGIEWDEAPAHLKRLSKELAGGKITAFSALWRALGFERKEADALAGLTPPVNGEKCELCGLPYYEDSMRTLISELAKFPTIPPPEEPAGEVFSVDDIE